MTHSRFAASYSGMNRLLRTPSEPAPPPVQEPPDEGPENPHAPVREPDPVEPAEI